MVRYKAGHPHQAMKQVFGCTQARYRAQFKNTHRAHLTCALVNLLLVR